MPTPTPAELLKYANLQMAAEARIDLFPALRDALTFGNGRSSLFPRDLADDFVADGWTVASHQKNTGTGFSGTLFRNRNTNELVLSFRSTEFVDDAARDNQATNAMEIQPFGWAFGQIADMENWVRTLGLSGADALTVTGYSLGGHLATAFDLLHPGLARATYTFNGAGVGTERSGSPLAETIARFDAMRSVTADLGDQFTDGDVRSLYEELRSTLRGGAEVTGLQVVQAQLLWLSRGPGLPTSADAGLLLEALKRIQAIQFEVARIAGYGSGTDQPALEAVLAGDIEATNLNYQLAVLIAARRTQNNGIVADALQTFVGRKQGALLPNFYDIFGDTSPSAVSNSQLHHGIATPIFIEDQPLWRGSVTWSSAIESGLYRDVKLLNDGFAINDFGDTHSIVLLVDSLSIQGALATLYPTVSSATLSTILRAASNARKESGGGTNNQGKAEGDVLENVLNVLSKIFLGPDASVVAGKLDGGTWSAIGDRNAFFARLKAVQESQAFKDVTGRIELSKFSGASGLVADATTDFASFLSLLNLSPFVLKARASDSIVVEASLAASWGSTRTSWITDKNMSASDRAAGDETFTQQWRDDRASLLDWMLLRNDRNLQSTITVGLAGRPIREAANYEDEASTLQMFVGVSDQPNQRKQVVFGGTGNNSLTGYGKDDHLYGGAGADILRGLGGADYLEGNADADQLYGGEGNDTLLGGAGDDVVISGEAGNDLLKGGAGKDTLDGGIDNDILYGGAGDDRLDGGTGNDILKGGDENDTYFFSAGWGKDTIEDSDGVGSIQVEGYGTLTGAGAIKIAEGRWQSIDGRVLFTIVPGSGSSGLDIAFLKNTGDAKALSDTLRVNKWTSGALGITLGGTVKPPVIDRTIVGDFDKQLNGFGDYLVTADHNYVSAGPVNSADDVLTGSTGAGDQLLGLNGNDALAGLDGDDALYGGEGDDFLLGGPGSDTLEGGTGRDVIFGSGRGALALPTDPAALPPVADGIELTRGFSWVWWLNNVPDDNGFQTHQARGADYSTLYDDANLIDGGAGGDWIYGATGDDTVHGGEGDDEIAGSAGEDVLFGDDGDDRIEGDGVDVVGYIESVPAADQANDLLIGGAGRDTMSGDGGDDELFGGDDDDRLYGDDSNPKVTPFAYHGGDYLDGGGGADELQGGGEDDTLVGGTGNDALYGDASLNQLDGGWHGDDLLDGEEGADYLEGGGGADTLYGGDDNDMLWGDAASSGLLSAQYGDDLLDGGGGDDTLIGGGRADTLYGGEGNDAVSGDGDGDQVGAADQGADYLDGEAGNDSLWGDGKSDTLLGGDGNDFLAGDGDAVTAADEGDDFLDGGAGKDTLNGNGGDDFLDGGAGDDFLDGGAGMDYVAGGAGDDFLLGGIGDDALDGGSGDDQLNGGAGADTLTGGAGADYLAGGAGDDTYVFATGDSALNAADFRDTVDDGGGSNVIVIEGAAPQAIVSSADRSDFVIVMSDGQDIGIVDGAARANTRYRFGSLDTPLATDGALPIDASESLTAGSLSSDADTDASAGVWYSVNELIGSFSDSGASGIDSEGHRRVLGGRNDDVIVSSSGDATISGGRGNDTLDGSGGGNSYLYSRGDGSDLLSDSGPPAFTTLAESATSNGGHRAAPTWRAGSTLSRSKRWLIDSWEEFDDDAGALAGAARQPLPEAPPPNRIVFGAGISSSDIRLGGAAGALTLSIGSDPNDRITFGAFDQGAAAAVVPIDSFVFADGTTLSYAELVARGFDGAAGDDVLSATAGNDRLDGRDGDDQLFGRAGDDTLIGGAGDDLLVGGGGSDRYVFRPGDGQDVIDSADAGSAVDILSIAELDPADVSLVANGPDLIVRLRSSTDQITVSRYFEGAAIRSITFDNGVIWTETDIANQLTAVSFTEEADAVAGTDDDDLYLALGGNDTVWGRGGSDLIDGGAGNDWLHGGAGADTLKGGGGRDVLEGDADDDLLEGGDDADLLAGGEGADTLEGGSGEDSLYGADGADMLSGGSGHDVLEGHGGDDQLDGGDGLDRLDGGAGNDSLAGGAGNDSLYGGDGDDRLDGGGGTDFLTGGDGDDTLFDGEWMHGGAGNDTYVLTSWRPNVTNTIEDVILGTDVLVLPEGSDPSQVRIQRTGGLNDLNLFGPESSLVVLSGFLSTPDVSDKVQEIRFGDGTVWSVADVFSQLAFTSRTEGDDEIHGFRWGDDIDGRGGNDLIYGWAGNDSLQGNAGADTLSGGDGDDVLDGGAGRDSLDGGSGNDTFLLDAASGREIIFDYDGEDRVLFAPDVSPGDVALFRDGLDLVISMSSGAMQARVKRHFADPPPPYDPNAGGFGDFSYSHLERIEFADGTVWNEAAIIARVTGSPDAMAGTPGDDGFIVDDARDTIVEAEDQGVDTVFSSVSFSLPANVENLTLEGYIDLTGVGNALDNRIVGNAGNNTLSGGSEPPSRNGRDTFAGGAGDDDYYLDSGEIGPFLLDPALFDVVIENPGEGFDAVWLYGGPYSFTLPDNVEALYVTEAHRAYLSDSHGPYYRSAIGNALDNTIELRNRDSLDPLTSAFWIIDGGLGADTLRGGDGSDIYVVDNAGDVVEERATSSQPDTVRASISYSLGERIENLELLGSDTISGTGNSLNNVLDGSINSAANVLKGGLGDDTYRLGVGDSVIESIGEGFDTVVFAYRPDDGVFHIDSVDASAIELFTLAASLGEGLTIVGSAAADSITYSGFGDPYRFPAPLGGTIEGLEGDDTLVGDLGSDRLDGGDGADRLSGDGGWDTLIGGEGSDWLDGGAGNDLLDGGTGDDSLDGGSGDDVYLFGHGAGRDEIGEAADTSLGKLNVIRFDAGVRSSDIVLSKSGADLIVALQGGSDRLVVRSFFLGDDPSNPSNPVQRFDFADGSSWGLGTIRAMALPGLANVAPVVAASLPDVIRRDDQQLDFSVPAETFADSDIGDALTFSATLASGAPLPGWLTFIRETGSFSGNTGAPVGAYAIRVTATDYAGLSASDDFNLTITTVGRTLTGTFSSDRLLGYAGDDTLLGLEGWDSLYGMGGDDALYGDADDDVLDGGAGSDLMVGGIGNDQYYVDDLGDAVVETAGEGDLDTVWTSVSYTMPANVEQLYLFGIAPIAIVGNAGANRIESYNTGSGNRLDGGVGADTLIGGPNDTFVVDDASDVVVSYTSFDGLGTNTVESSLSWALGADLKDLRLTGSQALDATGNSLNNHLFGNSGNNRLVGGGGIDTMAGGAGDDTYVDGSVLIEGVDEGVDTVEASGSWTLGANFENLKLTGTPVVIPGFTFFSDFSGTGNELANVIVGSAYRDVIDGKAGADTMNGGAGDDHYVVDDAGDVVGELAGGGMDLIDASISFELPTNVENLTLIGAANIDASGNEGANVLLGNAASNRLDGGAGADSMSGGAGNDTYVVDQAGDVVTERSGGGDDLVESSISWVAGAEIERLTLSGNANIDAFGNAVANTLTGNAGANRLDGGAGADRMLGGYGDDTYIVDNVGDLVLESAGAGIDTVESSVSATLASAVENLVLTGAQPIDGNGNELDNRLTGNAVANRLVGGAGNDTLDGGAGNDTLDGGAGDDTYLFARGHGTDTIIAIDSTAGKIDTISLAAGILVADLVITRETDDLVLTIRGTADSLRVRNHFVSNAASGAQIDRVRFADGTTWTVATIQGLLNTNHAPSLAVPLLDQAVARGAAFTYTVPAAAFADSDNDPLTYSARLANGTPLPSWLGFNAATRTFSGNSAAATLGPISIRVTASDPGGLSVSDVFDLTVRAPSTGYVIFGTPGNDYLSAGAGDDTIFAGAGDDWLWGGIGDNALYGEDGNDYLLGDVGKDTEIGGRGNDYYFVDRSDDVVVEYFNEGADTIAAQADYVLPANVETLYLSGSATSGTGNSLDNYLSADYRSFVGVVLDGGGGADQMSGTFGNDTYVVDNAGDSIYETLQMTVGTTTVVNTSVDTVKSWITYTLAGNLENLVLTGAAAVDGTGNAGANNMVGNAAPNRLTGGAGDDSLDGGAGNDTLDGSAGNDLLGGGLGNDTYLFNRGSGADVIDSLDPGAGKSDSLVFAAGVVASDILLTREGDDLLASMRGSADSVLVRNHFSGNAAGGSQIDQIRFADGTTWNVAAIQSLLSANHLPKVVAPLPDRTIAVGASFGFSFAASSFADADADALAFSVQMPDGSALPSWVTFDPATRTFSGLAPSSATMISVSVAASDPGGLTGFDTFDLTVGSTGGARALYGTPGNDSVFTGPSTNDTVYAGAGNDTVYGYVGNNALYGGAGNDYLSGGQGIDSLFGGSGNDSLSGDQGADNLFGGSGNDTFYVDNPADAVVELADEGDDVVTAYVDYALADNIERLTLVSGATHGTGNASNNFILASFNITAALFLDGGAGADTLYGALGNDTYTVDNAGDVVFEFDSFQTGGVTYFNSGIDTVNSWVSYAMPNNVERLSLLGTGNLAGTGNSLANAITGNGGNNALSGAGGNDTLTGGAGDDTLDGGAGNDTYTFGRGDAADVIASLDATAGKTDTLQLGATIASSDIVVTRQTNDLLVSIRETSDSVRVRNHFLGNGNQIDQIRFADGTSWNGQAIAGQLASAQLGGDSVSAVAFDMYGAGLLGNGSWAPDVLPAAPPPDAFAAQAQRLVDAMAFFASGADTPPLGGVHQVTLGPVTLPQHAF